MQSSSIKEMLIVHNTLLVVSLITNLLFNHITEHAILLTFKSNHILYHVMVCIYSPTLPKQYINGLKIK